MEILNTFEFKIRLYTEHTRYINSVKLDLKSPSRGHKSYLLSPIILKIIVIALQLEIGGYIPTKIIPKVHTLLPSNGSGHIKLRYHRLDPKK